MIRECIQRVFSVTHVQECVFQLSKVMMCRVIYWQTQRTLIKGKIKRGWNSVGCQQQQKKQEKKWARFQGSLLSALSASGSQSTTASIFHMRRSWCAGAAWVGVISRYCLHSVCVCVCGIIYGGTTQLCHHSNIWTPTPTSHCKSICGRNRRVSHSNPHSDIHTPAYLPAWTHNNAENISELGSGLRVWG